MFSFYNNTKILDSSRVSKNLDLRYVSLLKQSQSLDPSYKTDLDFWIVSEGTIRRDTINTIFQLTKNHE